MWVDPEAPRLLLDEILVGSRVEERPKHGWQELRWDLARDAARLAGLRELTVHSQGMSATFGTDHEPWRELFRFLAAAAPSQGAPPRVSPSVLRLPFVSGGAA